MIIVAIIALSGVVLVALYAALNGLPSMPSGVVALITRATTYLAQGCKFLMSFVYGDIVMALLTVTVTASAIVLGYRFVMWVAKKIPMFGVSD